MKVRFRKLSPDAVAPKKSHPSDAGFDLTAVSVKVDQEIVSYGFGLSVEIPEGYVGLVFPRSSVYRKDLVLSNCVGVIDSGYRGEISAKFRAVFPNLFRYSVGDRIAQLVIMPVPGVEFEEAESLAESDRGTGGYGSTGDK